MDWHCCCATCYYVDPLKLIHDKGGPEPTLALMRLRQCLTSGITTLELGSTVLKVVFSFPSLNVLSLLCLHNCYFLLTLFALDVLTQETLPVNSTTVVRTVKVLVVHMSPPSIDDAIGLMKCFPCLQKLYALVKNKASNQIFMYSYFHLLCSISSF